MLAKARVGYIRMSPRKVAQVMRLIRGKGVVYSLGRLENINKKAALYIKKLIQSAINNAKNKSMAELDLNSVYISRVVANPGPIMKRHRAASFGRAVMIRKRTSHLEIELDVKV